ncbi:hypothetical protein [Pseudomonas salmasensis]|uniref:hypothetical protein n=1 Tax=Pseudomonas salmasensis TaxID=2745514 RepID=UPI0016493893|nr:hypothetical protein [Pseudomonas salmasensis]QXH78613.1 hypothetical protein HU731_001955 [Pseudomonas salmasensis]
MSRETVRGTTGTFVVTVRGAQDIDFEGDPSEMRLEREWNDEWHLVGLRRLSNKPEDFEACDVYLPADLPTDGTPKSYQFGNNTARLHFWTRENQGNQTYVAFEGSVEVTFDGTHITASFSCTAAFGSSQLKLTNGKADLTGLSIALTSQYPATGELSVDFQGGPLPGSKFVATELRIDSSDFDGHRPDRRIFIGDHYDKDLPLTRNIFAIVIRKDEKGLTHDLADSNNVWIQFQRLDMYGTVTAHAGTLTLNEEVTDDHASGEFSCSFRRNDGPVFTAEGTFRLTRAE